MRFRFCACLTNQKNNNNKVRKRACTSCRTATLSRDLENMDRKLSSSHSSFSAQIIKVTLIDGSNILLHYIKTFVTRLLQQQQKHVQERTNTKVNQTKLKAVLNKYVF